MRNPSILNQNGLFCKIGPPVLLHVVEEPKLYIENAKWELILKPWNVKEKLFRPENVMRNHAPMKPLLNLKKTWISKSR